MTNGEIFKTVNERSEAYLRFCKKQDQCHNCKLNGDHKENGNVGCVFKWLDLEFTEEPKPCPFCGGEAKVVSTIHKGCEYHHVECTKCHGSSIGAILVDESIDAWNRRVS